MFRSRNSQAVRLPKQFRFSSEEVEIFRRGEEIVLREPVSDLQRAFDLLVELGDLVSQEREVSRPQEL